MTRVDYATIETILTVLDAQFSSTVGSTDRTLPIAYSKLSLLEISGWIEESMDTILFNYIDSKIIDATCKSQTKDVIRKNYSFDESHFYHIFICALGVNNLENILDHIGAAQTTVLMAKFNDYASKRNNAAHKYQLVTSTFPAPSQVLNDYRIIKPIISDLEQEVIRLI